jgi:hypothetical protein
MIGVDPGLQTEIVLAKYDVVRKGVQSSPFISHYPVIVAFPLQGVGITSGVCILACT